MMNNIALAVFFAVTNIKATFVAIIFTIYKSRYSEMSFVIITNIQLLNISLNMLLFIKKFKQSISKCERNFFIRIIFIHKIVQKTAFGKAYFKLELIRLSLNQWLYLLDWLFINRMFTIKILLHFLKIF